MAMCKECNSRKYEHQMLGGLKDNVFVEMCVSCASKKYVDVCHGYCLRWFDKSKLDKNGLCEECRKRNED